MTEEMSGNAEKTENPKQVTGEFLRPCHVEIRENRLEEAMVREELNVQMELTAETDGGQVKAVIGVIYYETDGVYAE